MQFSRHGFPMFFTPRHALSASPLLSELCTAHSAGTDQYSEKSEAPVALFTRVNSLRIREMRACLMISGAGWRLARAY
jgi:hypothetical protein